MPGNSTNMSETAAASSSVSASAGVAAAASAPSKPPQHAQQPPVAVVRQDDAIYSVARVLHRHILLSREERDATQAAAMHRGSSGGLSSGGGGGGYGSMRSTPRHTAASRAFALSTHGTPQIGGSGRSNSASPAPISSSGPGWATPLSINSSLAANDPRNATSSGSVQHSSQLCSPAFGSPFSSLSTPPSMALDAPRAWSASRNLGLHPFDLDVFDMDHYLARAYSAQVPLVSRIVPITAAEQRRLYHVMPSPPSLRDVWRLLKRIFDQARLNAECVIIALIYIERLMDTRGLALTSRNWIVVLATALLTASKIQDDHASFNAEFAAILPIFTCQQVNHMERIFLSTISYELYISADTYSAYYFGLKSLQGIRNTREIPRNYQAIGAGDAAIHASAMAQAQAQAQAAAAAHAQATLVAAAANGGGSSSGRATPTAAPASAAGAAPLSNLAATAKQIEAKTSAGSGAPEDVAPKAEFMV